MLTKRVYNNVQTTGYTQEQRSQIRPENVWKSLHSFGKEKKCMNKEKNSMCLNGSQWKMLVFTDDVAADRSNTM